MSIRMHLALLGAVVFVVAGCAGSDAGPEGANDAGDVADDADAGATEAADTTEAAAADAEDLDGGATDESTAQASGSEGDWCNALPTDEVQALFDDQLELGEPRSVESGGCVWPVVGAEGEGLMVTATTAGTFEALAAYEDGGGVETERLELGEEALLLNGADLVIRRDGGELRLALQAIFFSEEMGGDGAEAPDPEVTRQGLIDLAALALERTD
jgi:hypothetical protein